MHEDWLNGHHKWATGDLWETSHQTIFLCDNPSVHCIQTSKPKVKGSTPVRSSWIFSEYSMPAVIIER